MLAGEALRLGARQGHWPFQSTNESLYLDAASAHLSSLLPLGPALEEPRIGCLSELPFGTQTLNLTWSGGRHL